MFGYNFEHFYQFEAFTLHVYGYNSSYRQLYN